MRFGVWTPMPHTIRPEPEMDRAIAELGTAGNEIATDRSFEFAIDVVRRGEDLGFDITLVAERFHGPDLESLMLAAAMAPRTRNIELLAAVHPGIITPQVVAKMGASLDRISGGRFAVNIVNGWWKEEFDLYANGGWLGDQDARYRRMDEYIQVLRGLWTEDPFTLHGDFYRVDGAGLPIKPTRRPHPPIYAASRSPVGRETVARYCDVWFMAYEPAYALWAENMRTMARDAQEMSARAAGYGRRLEFGISAHVICADTLAEAEAKAAELEAHGRRDPVSMVAAKALGPGLVGTAAVIAERMEQYAALGVSCFMLHFHPMKDGMERFAAEVMPHLRRQAA